MYLYYKHFIKYADRLVGVLTFNTISRLSSTNKCIMWIHLQILKGISPALSHNTFAIPELLQPPLCVLPFEVKLLHLFAPPD